MRNRLIKWKRLAALHGCILIYSITSILSKYAARQAFFSKRYLMLLALEILVLGIFAVLWQQAIKNFKPSVAYSNKAVTIIWVLIASEILFDEGITGMDCLGSLLIICGVILVVQDG